MGNRQSTTDSDDVSTINADGGTEQTDFKVTISEELTGTKGYLSTTVVFATGVSSYTGKL